MDWYKQIGSSCLFAAYDYIHVLHQERFRFLGMMPRPATRGKFKIIRACYIVPFKHLKSRWIIIVVANPPKRDMNLAGSRKFLALVVLTLEKQPLEGVSAIYITW